ncbi:hypothetical protein B0O80DRAFT_449306 [Mortierella sp. GBAus27b]|nr:hypothetical protein B0O80DRAFT_449306 [Mortierella sp. GBAus27b]
MPKEASNARASSQELGFDYNGHNYKFITMDCFCRKKFTNFSSLQRHVKGVDSPSRQQEPCPSTIAVIGEELTRKSRLFVAFVNCEVRVLGQGTRIMSFEPAPSSVDRSRPQSSASPSRAALQASSSSARPIAPQSSQPRTSSSSRQAPSHSTTPSQAVPQAASSSTRPIAPQSSQSGIGRQAPSHSATPSQAAPQATSGPTRRAGHQVPSPFVVPSPQQPYDLVPVSPSPPQLLQYMSPPPVPTSLAPTPFLDIVPISAQMTQHDIWRTVLPIMDEHIAQLNRNVKAVLEKNERIEDKLSSILQLLERDQGVSRIP